MPLSIMAGPQDTGKRLDAFLVERLEGWSRAQVQELIEREAVLLGTGAARKSHRMVAGQSLSVDVDSPRRERRDAPGAEDIPLSVIYEDEAVMAIDKPAGLVVHPGNGNRTGTIVNALLFHTNELSDGTDSERPGIVHRLDKDTSGVLLVARTDSAHAALSRQFAQRRIHKTYYGICIGSRPPQEGTLDGPVGRSRRDPARFCITHAGRPAVTDYRLRAWRSGIAVVEFSPHTGRTHQIRVHAAGAHIPIVADTVYGNDRERISELEPLERPFAWKVAKCFGRQALHARRITFEHPVSGLAMTLEAPFPRDFSQALGLFERDVDPAGL